MDVQLIPSKGRRGFRRFGSLRFSWLLIFGLLLCWLLLPSGMARAAEGDATPKRPNLLLIVIDTLRSDRLSSYGYTRPTSPEMDRLAAEGVLYEQAISASSWTLPSHASLFTGLYPRDHRTTSENTVLDDSFETLAEQLQAAGYRTAGFSNNVWTNDESGLKQGFEAFEEMWHLQATRQSGVMADDPKTDMGGVATTEKILEWVGKPSGKPFFVFVNYYEPHLPYRPTRPFGKEFLPKGTRPHEIQRLRSFYSPREYGYILDVPWMKVSDRDIEILGDLYDGEISYIDHILGDLRKGLEEAGQWQDTLVVVTSDHGEHLGENHMLSHKLSVYDPLLRVPLILYGPGRLPTARRIQGQVQVHDVFGSLLDWAGVRDDLPQLPLEEPKTPRYTFAELDTPNIFLEVIRKKIPGWDASAFARALKTVRGPRYKLILGSDARAELFDHVNDPLETQDLSAEKPEVVQRLRRALEAFEKGEMPGVEEAKP